MPSCLPVPASGGTGLAALAGTGKKAQAQTKERRGTARDAREAGTKISFGKSGDGIPVGVGRLPSRRSRRPPWPRSPSHRELKSMEVREGTAPDRCEGQAGESPPWSCVTKTKYMNNSALLLKCVITFLSKITSFCKENCVLLYNYYYESPPTLVSLVGTRYDPNGCENQLYVNILFKLFPHF